MSTAPVDPTPPLEQSVQTEQVLRRFKVVFNALRTHFQQVEKQAGIGGAQVWALSVVRDRPGIGITELSLVMDLHQSTTSNLVKALVQRGLLQATKAADDRRNVQLHIREEALEVLGRVAGPFEGMLPLALSRLPLETLDRLHQDLIALTGVLHADDAEESIPLAGL